MSAPSTVAPTLVLLPGLACDAALWAGIQPALAARLPIVVSDVHARGADLPSMARAVLDEHAGPLILCGASMGGMIALRAALLDAAAGGRRVVGLVLCGSSARAESPEIRERRATALRMIGDGHFEDVIQANVPFAFHVSRHAEFDLLRAYLEMLRRTGPAELMRQNRAIDGREDLRPRLGEIRCPTLVLCGDQDLITAPEASRELARGIPAAELEMFGDCGHMLTMERPQPVADAIGRWLARRYGR